MIDMLYNIFRHWSMTGSVWILSDTHFNDSDCKLMDKDWITPEEQVQRINKLVYRNDTLVLLGDIGDPKYLEQLKVDYKILICGNHDYSCLGKYRDYFNEIYTGPVFIAEKILLSHEPIKGLPWCLNIHGHDHSNMEGCDDIYHLNLAANVCNYTPVNLNKIIKDGRVSAVTSLNRMTIDKANERHKKEDKTIFINNIIPDYVSGYLRYGHYEGEIVLSKEEYEEFLKNPKDFAINNDITDSLKLKIDDYRVEGIGAADYSDMTFYEVKK